jgi:hypothetical protein
MYHLRRKADDRGGDGDWSRGQAKLQQKVGIGDDLPGARNSLLPAR